MVNEEKIYGKFRYEAEVETVDGECDYLHKVGDKFILNGYSTPDGLCGGAYWVLYPAVMRMECGGETEKVNGREQISQLACPHNGMLKLKLTKLKN